MKKIYILLASAAALLAASCNKIEAPIQDGSSSDIKLNLTVSGFGGSDTKAAKTGWVSGDKINIWFDDWNYSEKVDNPVPDMIISYDGSAWAISSQVEGLSSRLKNPGGNLTAVYEGFNDLSKYTYQWYNNGEWFHPAKYNHPDANYRTAYHNSMVVYKVYNSYSYDGTTLTANLDNWYFGTQFKVLIKGSTMSADESYLQVKKAGKDEYADCKGAIVVNTNSNYPTISDGSSNYNGFAGGVQEADGIAFYYSSLSASSEDIEFNLYNGSTKVATFTAAGKTVSCEKSKCVNVAINYSSFSAL